MVSMITRRKFLVFLLGLILLVCYGVIIPETAITLYEKYQSFPKPEPYFECVLKESDPWDPSILPYFNAEQIQCKSDFQNLTYFSDGLIKVNWTKAKDGTKCLWQCLIPKKGEAYEKGLWMDLEISPKCEIIKVKCFTGDNEIYYESWHTQIIPKKVISNSKSYNVHILVLDAVSRSHGIRSLPKSIDYLLNQLKATHFPFYTKIGWASTPNGYAALVGQKPYRDNIPPTIARLLCDNQKFENHYVGNIFQKHGFATLLNEDMFSIFSGEDVNPDHTLAPLATEYTNTPMFNETWMYDEQCQKSIDFQFDFLTKFIKAYKGKSKFSLNWNTYIAHDFFQYLKLIDDQFLEFLKENKDELDESFFILLGDHGPNFGPYRLEKVMEYEETNPMLYISIPKTLREDVKLQKILTDNSQKLISHYDLYASLIDIADTAGADISEDITFHGQSFFKTIKNDRDCRDMGILPMYCPCRYEHKPIPPKSPLIPKIMEVIFTPMNETIWPYRSKCIIPLFDQSFKPKIQQILLPGTTASLHVYQVTFQTLPEAGPIHARWNTYISVKYYSNGTINIQNMLQFGNRLNPNPKFRRRFTSIMGFCFWPRFQDL